MCPIHTPQQLDNLQHRKSASLWRNPDFLLLSSGQIVSVLGSRISSLALPLLVLALTHSPALAGFLLALDMLPWLLFSLPLGALLDRWNRKTVMILCDVVRLLTLGSVPAAFFLGHLSVVQLCFVAFLSGSANVFFELAQLAALPNIVHPRQLARAYSITELTTSSSKLIGPPLGGLIIGLARTIVVGAVLAYLIDSLTYLASVITLRFMRVPFQSKRQDPVQQSLWQDILEGLRLLWQQPLLRILVLLTATVNFLMVSLTLIIIVKATALHATPVVIGLIFGMAGAAGFIGGIIAPWMRMHLRFGHIIVGCVLLWAAACSLLALASVPPLLAAGAALIDLLWPVYSVVLVTYRLSLVPDHVQGRINSSFRFVSYGSEALGSALGGLFLTILGAAGLLWLICAGLVLCALVSSCTQLRQA
jgi:MFS family permease